MRTGAPDTPGPQRLIRINDLLASEPNADILGEASTPITGIEYDSRKVAPGNLFVALVGSYDDGHDFVGQAIERGARAVLVDRPGPVEIPQIVVPNTRASLAKVAASYYGHPSRELEVVGITGTDGKTTTAHIVEAIFTAAGRSTGMIGTVGVRIGSIALETTSRQTTPESLEMQRHFRRMVDAGVDVAIVEATSHGLDLHRLDETEFLTGAVTNITHEHLEHHKTIDAYRRAKAILFERVGMNRGSAVINLDDEGARSMAAYAAGAQILTYSATGQSADLRAVDIKLSVSGSAFQLASIFGTFPVKTSLIGGFNVANALCAIGIVASHDISHEHWQPALSQLLDIPGRMQLVNLGQPFAVVVDYAHTPDSVEKVLRLMRDLNPNGRLIIVMGSAGERDRDKRPLQGRNAAKFADLSVFTTEDPRFEDPESIIDEIAAGATAIGAIEGTSYLRITDRQEAIFAAFMAARPGDCVILAGKGHEQSIIWGKEQRPWDEVTVATDLLVSMGHGV